MSVHEKTINEAHAVDSLPDFLSAEVESSHRGYRPEASRDWESKMKGNENFAKLVSPSIERLNYKAEEVIFHEGDPADQMFILTSGRAQITVRNQLLEDVEEGGIFGEMGLADAGPRSATVSAATDCEIAPIDARRFQLLAREHPFFALQVIRVLSRRIGSMNSRGLLAEEA